MCAGHTLKLHLDESCGKTNRFQSVDLLVRSASIVDQLQATFS